MLPCNLKLFFDGSCEPKNPGGVARYGWRIMDMADKEVDTGYGEVCRGPIATNNIAEWAAVTNGLRYLKNQEWQGTLEIFGDSQLVIRQLTGQYKVKKDTLIPYYQECIGLLENSKWTATWIPREENEECDRLSKFIN